MNESHVSTLQFIDYKIKNFNFALNDKYVSDKEPEINVEFSSEVKMQNDNDYNVLLSCSINEQQNKSQNVPFLINITIEGIFKTEMFNEKLIPNSIAILFPYLRSFMSTVTAQAGINPFILPTINVNNLLNEQKQ